jgi:hypothetical protein
MKAEPLHFPVRVELQPKHTYWGETLAWRFSPNEMKAALAQFLRIRGGPFVLSCRDIGGRLARARSVRMEHFQEGAFQLIFRTHVELQGGDPIRLCAVVSKDGDRCSRVGRAEYRNLQELHARRPDLVVRPLRTGFARLMSRNGSPARYTVYFTEWLPDFHELGVDRHMRFFINEKPFHHFDEETTAAIKRQIIQLCMDLHDPKGGRALETPLIGAGDIVITRPVRGEPLRIKLIAARRIRRGLSAAAARRMYETYEGEWGGEIFRLAEPSRDGSRPSRG